MYICLLVVIMYICSDDNQLSSIFLLSLGPNEIYNKPVTTNMKYGWWMKDGVEKELWTKTDRHSCVHSEMTRYRKGKVAGYQYVGIRFAPLGTALANQPANSA